MKYLIVDDDADLRLLLDDILSTFGRGHQACDGSEATFAVRLAVSEGQPYDFICLDIMMPGKNGHETLQAIRQIEREGGVCAANAAKVIMTTSIRDRKNCLQAFSEGCDNYIVKPVDENELLEKMRVLGVLPTTLAGSSQIGPWASWACGGCVVERARVLLFPQRLLGPPRARAHLEYTGGCRPAACPQPHTPSLLRLARDAISARCRTGPRRL